ncbi:MAG: hypothetical protein H0U43_09815 [Chthoniobacterales bacterium]|nr:hypothetical protein [Chthoniobacterales bacterium]
MRATDRDAPQFYFALPRLIASLRGGNSARTEKNWLEANVVGAAVMLLSYLAISRLLIPPLPLWAQIALLPLTALATWIFWQLVFYINAQIIKMLRSVNLIRDLSNARAQSAIAGIIATAFGWWLLSAPGSLKALGTVWLIATCLNLIAAGLLALRIR